MPSRNLIYHVYPAGNWRWNLEQLAARAAVFTGKKYFAIAIGRRNEEELDVVVSVIKNIFKDAEFGVVPNDYELRETASLLKLLRANRLNEGITFYGHTKGTTREGAWAVKAWTEAMYHHCLDRIEEVDEALTQFACCGTFKRYGEFTCMPPQVQWHYSGTFWWFNNEKLYSRLNWELVPEIRHGAEAYPGWIFRSEEAACLFADRFQGSPYDAENMQFILESGGTISEVQDGAVK